MAHAHKKGEKDGLVLEVFPAEESTPMHTLEQHVKALALPGVTWVSQTKLEGACGRGR